MIGVPDTPETTPTFTEIVNTIKNEISDHSTGGVYYNFLTGHEKWQRAEDVFTSEVYQKLIDLKAEYDPENLFSFSLNIPPAADRSFN